MITRRSAVLSIPPSVRINPNFGAAQQSGSYAGHQYLEETQQLVPILQGLIDIEAYKSRPP
jgi:hypothetical protein